MVTFGDFGETEGYTTTWDYIFFFLAVFLICLIMMNLLIGVLSEELGAILGIYEQVVYEELLDLLIGIEILNYGFCPGKKHHKKQSLVYVRS
jgi:hypothetical protein